MLGLIAVVAFFPGSPRGLYYAVGGPAKIWESRSDELVRDYHVWAPDHVIQKDRLYLRVQVTRPALLFMYAVRDDWNPTKIRVFRADHPELEGYWAEPTRTDGGVRWLRNPEE